MSSSTIEGDMYERAAMDLVKNFYSQSSHATYLQMQRAKGNAGMVVVNPATGQEIDTCTYVCGRATHR